MLIKNLIGPLTGLAMVFGAAVTMSGCDTTGSNTISYTEPAKANEEKSGKRVLRKDPVFIGAYR